MIYKPDRVTLSAELPIKIFVTIFKISIDFCGLLYYNINTPHK